MTYWEDRPEDEGKAEYTGLPGKQVENIGLSVSAALREDKMHWRKTAMLENHPTVQTHGAPGVIDPTTIQGFLNEYGKLETSVSSGECGPVERMVYWTAQLALQSARNTDELRKMLQQLAGLGQVVYVTYHFPASYRHHFEYAGRLYGLLVDTLPPLSEARLEQ